MLVLVRLLLFGVGLLVLMLIVLLLLGGLLVLLMLGVQLAFSRRCMVPPVVLVKTTIVATVAFVPTPIAMPALRLTRSVLRATLHRPR